MNFYVFNFENIPKPSSLLYKAIYNCYRLTQTLKGNLWHLKKKKKKLTNYKNTNTFVFLRASMLNN